MLSIFQHFEPVNRLASLARMMDENAIHGLTSSYENKYCRCSYFKCVRYYFMY
mgnify:CR=1 FL=1